MEELSILPRKIYKFKADPKLIEDALPLLREEEYRPNQANRTTDNDYLLNDEKYKDIKEWIMSCLEKLRVEMNYLCDELTVTQSWANLSGPGDWHPPHIHPNSILSGIIYLTESVGYTQFKCPNDWYITSNTQVQAIKVSFEPEASVSNDEYISSPGDMIIFPSSFMHGADPHEGENNDRITISFNVFPTGKIGRDDYLSGLTIEVK